MQHDHDLEAGGQEGSAIWLDRVNEAYYDQLSERMGMRTRERVNWMCAQCEGTTVLDVGCSQGITSILLGREGFRVLGIDIMVQAVDYANRELTLEPAEVQARVAFQRMDLLSMPVGDGYDNVVLGEVVEHQTSAARFLRAARRHVAPGGRMIVTVPFGLHPFPDHKCTVFPRDVVDALDGFSIATLEVVGGYTRVVAINAGDVAAIDRDRLLDVTQAGTEQEQGAHFEAAIAARKVADRRRELAEKLKEQYERSRKQTRDSDATISRAREELAQLKSQLLVLRNESLTASGEADRLRRNQEALETQAARASQTLAETVAQLDQARRSIAQFRIDASKSVREREAAQHRHDRKVEQMADYRRRLEHQHETVKSWLNDANQELVFIKESVSFRLGLALMSGFRSPRDFIALPVRIGRLISSGFRRRAARRNAPRSASDPKEVDPGLAWNDPAAIAAHAGKPGSTAGSDMCAKDDADAGRKAIEVADVRPVSLATEWVPMLPLPDRETAPATSSQPIPERVADLRVAAIMDDFTRESFRHCCELRQLTPDAWQDQLTEFRPHLVLVESAWKGENEQWARKIYPLSVELTQMVAWAREAGIPTAFWNKEDPVHFSVFLPTARLFDHVFTTDIDCIKGYRLELGHDRVHLLPFACEPRTHNPIETHERVDGFCFAGSYYLKYPERQRDFSTIVDTLRKVSTVDIYDRNYGKNEPSLQFPEAYVPLIRGNLPYDQIDRAYKGYRYGININTVKQSQSMFARRAFDLLSSNTVTVSNFSRGLRLMFGDLVISSDNGREVARRIEPLLADERMYRKFRVRGLRKVMAEHTYEDRLAFVVGKLTGTPSVSSLPRIRVVAGVADRGEAAAVLAAYTRQRYADRSLLLVLGAGLAPSELPVSEGIEVRSGTEVAAERIADGTDQFVAVFNPGDYYGPHYLTDLALATRYSAAQVIGKGARFIAGPDGAISLQGDGIQYRAATSLPLRAAIVRVDAIGHASWAELVADPEAIVAPELAALAIDEFNYCAYLHADRCEQADDLDLDAGIDLSRLQEIAESPSQGRARAAANTHLFTGFGPGELARLFPAGEYLEGRVRFEPGQDGIAISSRLGEDKFTYVYANAPVPVETLFPDEIGRFNMLVSSDMLLSLTLIFLDEAFKRIGHVIRACNSNQGLVPLEGTRYVMIGFRIQGAGLATLRRLVLQHVPPDVDAIAGAGRQLLVSRGYPAYDDLYSYTFVHRRVQGYRQSQLSIDVFRLDSSPISYEEFEGVDIVSGNVGDLSLMIDSNRYDSILVHSFDEQLWSAIESSLESTRVIVWVHGAEIQPWYRRDFNNVDDAERKRAIQRSDMRIGLWRRVLQDMPDNLHLVFVSEFLARQAMQDLGIEIPRGKYSVIHNVVDGDYFTFQQKSAEQRHRVLSIRPYSKRTYANDLAVKAIIDLAREPWFGELRFSLFGDGSLFEETVAPLREGFPNVRIERRFLSRGEIRELHRENGVFLVPSRIDSQGVSRDEAMASGLVPVTNRVSAIPEFVDDHVAMLAPAEDWRGLADGIRALHDDPDRFVAMSARAAAHVRNMSGQKQTLQREVDLILARSVRHEPLVVQAPLRIAVYGDLNINLIDGSAVWAASLVEVLAGLADVTVDFYLKTRLSNTRVLARVLDLPNVRLIEPSNYGDVPACQPEEAVERIANSHAVEAYEAVVLRGYRLCLAASREPRLHGRLWAYMTDIPQSGELLDAEWRQGLGHIARAARFMLCQTAALETLVEQTIPPARGKTRRLPPMVPGELRGAAGTVRQPSADGVLRIAYAGKFAPLWGIREMLDVIVALNRCDVACELHVFGDKIHNPSDDPGFRDEVRARLQETPGVVWHGGVPRDVLLAALPGLDVGWAWRHAELERTTLELSTKVLEYGLSGLPSIMRAGQANTEAFGADYPLFADSPEAIVELLARAAAHPELLRDAARRSREVADRHTFTAIREQWVAGLLSTRGREAAGADRGT